MKIKLDDVIEALEFVNMGMDTEAYLNPKTYEIVYIDEFSNISEEEKEEVYDEYLCLPTKYDIDEYNMIEEFIETIEDEIIYNQLYISINGKGAFRRFKDTCINFDIIDDWYKFRDEKYKELAIEWCKENNIEYVQSDKVNNVVYLKLNENNFYEHIMMMLLQWLI